MCRIICSLPAGRFNTIRCVETTIKCDGGEMPLTGVDKIICRLPPLLCSEVSHCVLDFEMDSS